MLIYTKISKQWVIEEALYDTWGIADVAHIVDSICTLEIETVSSATYVVFIGQ